MCLGPTFSQGFLIAVTKWEGPFLALPFSREKSQEQSWVGVGALAEEQQDYFVYLSFPVMTSLPENFSCSILTRFLRFSNDSQLSQKLLMSCGNGSSSNHK